MKYFDKTFFRFLFGFVVILLLGLVFVSNVAAALVNINTASLTELDALPGVGPTIAQRIIDGRPYGSVGEISEVEGIGEPGSSSYDNIIGLITVGDDDEELEEEEQDDITEESSGGIPKAPLKLIVSGDKLGTVGTPLSFRAEIVSNSRAKMYWSFGDGSTDRGGVVEHAYAYPGEYVVVLKAESLRDSWVSRLDVKIVPDTLAITQASPQRVEVFNSGKDEINLFGRKIVSNGKEFIFPEDTIIKGGQKISFSSAVTGLDGNSAKIIIASEKVPVAQEIDKTKVAEIESQVLSLQRKQIEIRKAETQQFAAPMLAASTSPARNDEPEKSWLRTLKKFFGFR